MSGKTWPSYSKPGRPTRLQEAYDAACWLNPDIRAILIEEAEHGTAARGEPS